MVIFLSFTIHIIFRHNHLRGKGHTIKSFPYDFTNNAIPVAKLWLKCAKLWCLAINSSPLHFVEMEAREGVFGPSTRTPMTPEYPPQTQGL